MSLDPQDMPPPHVVSPQPTPLTLAHGVISADQGFNLGVIEIFMLTGKVTLFLTSAELRGWGKAFVDHADRVDSTPITVHDLPPGLLGPSGQPF